MDNRVLVVYASKYGATAEIAEKITQVLRQAGLHTDVSLVDRVRDLTPYRAVVLGSAVYAGKWRKEAEKFLRANEKPLGERRVWLFSSGPTGKGDPGELTRGWRFPATLQIIADRIKPKDIALFHGSVDVNKLNFIEKQMLTNVNALTGDYRDWQAITSWAISIADSLRSSAS